MKQLSIRQKILILLVPLVLFVIFSNIISYYLTASRNDKVLDHVEAIIANNTLVGDIQKFYLDYREEFYTYAFFHDVQSKKSLNYFKQGLNKRLEKLSPQISADTIVYVQALRRDFKQYFQQTDKVLRSADSATSVKSFKKNNKQLLQQIDSSINGIVLINNNLNTNYKQNINFLFVNEHQMGIVIVILTVTIILTTSFLQLRVLTKPIDELLDGVRLIWAGSTDHKIFIETKDEIGELADVFNQMAGSVGREKKRLFEKATTDAMTGLYNFRFFNEYSQQELDQASMMQYPVSLIIMDVDFFKHYNDTNGHPAGDGVLKGVAEVIKSSVRGRDIPARYGGEEFVVLLPSTPKQSACMVAERIRKGIELKEFHNQASQPNGNVTISLGVATFPDDASTAKDLLESADKALYTSKTTGKNRVTALNNAET